MGLRHIDPTTADYLNEIIDVLFPLNKWIAEKKYVPPGQLPWRNGDPISARDLGVVPFIDALFDNAPVEKAREDQFEALRKNPLKFCPIKNVSEWRAARFGGDEKPATFAIEKSGNLPLADGRVVIRKLFYNEYFGPLHGAVLDAKKAAGFGWTTFVEGLVFDTSPFWRSPKLKPSLFMIQLAKDAVRAMTSMRNEAADELTQAALLIELGEHRRVGNRYGRAECEDARKKFEQLLAELESAVQPVAARPPAAPFYAPVGSPPITRRGPSRN
jgi:hypothetical protein